MMWSPLTPLALRVRLLVMIGAAAEEAGAPEGLLFSLISCDNCGAMLDLKRRADLAGWTYSGSVRHGFQDRCPECSTQTYNPPAPRDGG